MRGAAENVSPPPRPPAGEAAATSPACRRHSDEIAPPPPRPSAVGTAMRSAATSPACRRPRPPVRRSDEIAPPPTPTRRRRDQSPHLACTRERECLAPPSRRLAAVLRRRRRYRFAADRGGAAAPVHSGLCAHCSRSTYTSRGHPDHRRRRWSSTGMLPREEEDYRSFFDRRCTVTPI